MKFDFIYKCYYVRLRFYYKLGLHVTSMISFSSNLEPIDYLQLKKIYTLDNIG